MGNNLLIAVDPTQFLEAHGSAPARPPTALGGFQTFDSSTGFGLPDGSVLSPDASLVRLERW